MTTKRNVLASMLLQLEDDAIEVLHAQAQRMLRGREQYGKLEIDKDRRDWLEQALEEHVDATTYQTIELIKLRRMLGRNNR